MQRAKLENPDRVLPSKEEPLFTASQISGIPNIVYRMCRTPDCKRVVGGWMLYEDVNAMFNEAKGWDIPTNPDPLPYDVRPIPGKGRGMIASRKIICGEVIVQDRPILMAPMRIVSSWPDPVSVNKVAEKGLLQLFYWLEPHDRELILSLHNCKPISECGPLFGILRTNGMGITYNRSQSSQLYNALPLRIAMANHSCSPNALSHTTPENPLVQLRAVRDIAAGDEITISYLDQYFPRTKRQTDLFDDYGFKCTCPSCSASKSSIKASDSRRKFIKDSLGTLDNKWKAWLGNARGGLSGRRSFIDHLRAVINAMETENLDNDRCEVATKLAFSFAALGDEKNCGTWAAEVVRTLPRVENQMNILTTWQMWQRQPRSMPLWRKRR